MPTIQILEAESALQEQICPRVGAQHADAVIAGRRRPPAETRASTAGRSLARWLQKIIVPNP